MHKTDVKSCPGQAAAYRWDLGMCEGLGFIPSTAKNKTETNAEALGSCLL